ncbi:MAG TPA: PEP-CTERM sorting domain-containing protein [Pirellulales bacterium]|jgi:hypothetical protein|nr:PEP-CTERM sorting domain-containing protein [Pirellulales bacterium]
MLRLRCGVLIASIVGFWSLGTNAKADFIVNGDFSSPTTDFWTGFNAGDNTDIPGWTVDTSPGGGVQVLAANVSGPGNGYGFPTVPVAGEQGLQLLNDSLGGLTQTITGLTPGDYTIDFYIGARNAGDSSVSLFLDGSATPIGTYTAVGDGNSGSYLPESLTYDETGTSLTLDFQGVSGTPMLQNVSVTPASVPEPASLLLFSLGAIGVGFATCRRRG